MKRRLAFCLVVLTAVAVGWRLEWQAAAQLNRERETVLRENRRLIALRAEHERLTQAQLSTADRDALLRDAVEAHRLKKLTATPPSPAAQTTANSVSDAHRASGSSWVNATEYKNRGRATPGAALTTVLWAAANGEVDILRDTLELAPEARAALQAILARLDRHQTPVPAAYASPEGLAALYTARDALAERVSLKSAVGLDSDHAEGTLAIQTAEGSTRETTLSLHLTDGEWRLVMPYAAAQKIGVELSGSAATAAVDRPPPQR